LHFSPSIHLLDRYIIRAFFNIFWIVLVALLGVFTIADFVEKIDNFVDAQASLSTVLLFYWYSIPYFIDTALPMCMLLATVISLGNLNKQYEIAAMRASGVSLWRLAAPLLALGVVLTIFQFLFQNFVVMPFNHNQKEITRNEIKPKRQPSRMREVVRQDLNGNIVVFKTYNVKENTGKDVTVLAYQDSGLTERWDYPLVTWSDSLKEWHYIEGLQRAFDSEGRLLFTRMPGAGILPLTITPQDIRKEQIRPDEMNIFQLSGFIEKKQLLGLNPRRWQADFHFKIAFVLTGFITIFLGIPFALQGTRENLSLAVGKSIVALFIYYILLIGGQKFAYKTSAPVAISVWFGDVVFFLTGLVLFIRQARK